MIPVTTYIVKTTSICNLNCSYCYIFNLADKSFHGRPKVMALDTVAVAARRMVEQARSQQVARLNVAFHGGEPLLAGKGWMESAVHCFQRQGGDSVKFQFSLQTNGTLLDEEWLRLLHTLDVRVSVSLDGLPEVHNRTRVNFAGKGSYDDTVRGIRLLQGADGRGIFGGVLCVVDPHANGLKIYRHFRQLGIHTMDFLLPLDHNWDNPPDRSHNEKVTPYADYLIPIFDEWWNEDNPSINIRYFETILTGALDQGIGVDSLGGHPISFVILDTGGEMEPLDSLRACGDGFTNVGLNIHTDSISRLYDQMLFQMGLLGQEGLSEICQICPLRRICGGGYLPHRYSREWMFRNPSIYCRDLWKLINHILAAAVSRVGRTGPAAADHLISASLQH